MNTVQKSSSLKSIQECQTQQFSQNMFEQPSEQCPRSTFFQEPQESKINFWIPEMEKEANNLFEIHPSVEIIEEQTHFDLSSLLKDQELSSTNQLDCEPKSFYTSRVFSTKSFALKKKQRRNNLIKFIMRTFCKNMTTHKNIFSSIKEYKKIQAKVKKFKEHQKERNNANITLAELSGFFGTANTKEDQSISNRRVMQTIVSKNMKKQIFQNNQIKQKMLYLTTMKVYKLRTCSANLCDRIEC